jgi:hypothetical protein
VRDIFEKGGAGEADGGIGFAEVTIDAVGISGLGEYYLVSGNSRFDP